MVEERLVLDDILLSGSHKFWQGARKRKECQIVTSDDFLDREHIRGIE